MSFDETEGSAIVRGKKVMVTVPFDDQQNETASGNSRTYFEGVPVYASEFGDLKNGAAVTLPGIGIFVNPSDLENTDLLRHEFGHILQARKYGMGFFYEVIAPASLVAHSFLRTTKVSGPRFKQTFCPTITLINRLIGTLAHIQ